MRGQTLTSRLRGSLLVSLLLAPAGCGGGTDEPTYPTDDVLLERLTEHPEAFEALAEDPNDLELQDSLGIGRIRVMGPGADAEVRLEVWYHDLPGPGGCSKGYAYRTEPPRETVDSIGSRWADCPPEEAELLRHLEGNWYAYLTAVN